MKTLINLSEVFSRHSTHLRAQADAGLPFSVLVSDADKQGTPRTFGSYEEADAHLETINRAGIDAAVAWTKPFAQNPKTGYRLYIRPRKGFGRFDC